LHPLRRSPSEIALELMNCIDSAGGSASKWDLIKILGNESQFQYWVEEFMIRDKFITTSAGAEHRLYKKTESGELFHRLLKNGSIMRAFVKVSGRKLRRGL
jgi:hypothetical protein